MPKFPDILLNNNPDAPSLDLNNLQVKGVGIFANTTERDNLNTNIQTEGYLAIMKDDDNVYMYTGGGWTTASNWARISGTLEITDGDGNPIGDVSTLVFPEGTISIIGNVGTVDLSSFATALQLAALQSEVDNIETSLGLTVDGNPPATTAGDFLISDGTNFGVSVYSLPTTDGTVGQFLQTDGAGNVSFATISATLEGLTDTPSGYGTAGQVLITNGIDGFTFGSGSPWIADTDGIHYQGGNVGIGANSDPLFDLNVAGDTKIGNDLEVYGLDIKLGTENAGLQFDATWFFDGNVPGAIHHSRFYWRSSGNKNAYNINYWPQLYNGGNQHYILSGQFTPLYIGSGNDTLAVGAKNIKTSSIYTTIRNLSIGAAVDTPSYTFPNTDGTANQYLQTDGAGNLSFATLFSPWEQVSYTGQTAIKYENGVVGIKDSAVPYSTNANLLVKAAQFPVDSGSQSSGTLMHLHEGKMIFTTDNSSTGFIGASFLGTTHGTTDIGSIGLYNRKAWISGGEGVALGGSGTAGISTLITNPGTSGQIIIGGTNFDTRGGIQLSGDTGSASNYHKIVMGGQIIFHGHTQSKYVAISRRGSYGTDGGVQISGGMQTGLFAHFAASDPNTFGTYGYLGININSPQVGGPAFEVSSSYAKFNNGLHIGDITATGYAFPTATGTTGQVLKVDANGDLVFGDGNVFTSYTGSPPLSNSNASAIEWSPTTAHNTMYLGFDPTTTPFLFGDGSIKMGGRLEASGDVISLASVQAPQFYSTSGTVQISTIPNTSRVLIGKNAGPNSGSGNILIGQNTGQNLQSGDVSNVMIGVEAGRSTEGDYNTFIGNIAGNQRFSSYNTAIGASALRAPSGSVTTDNTGENNTAVGYQAGISVTTANGQVFLGYNAGMNSNATNSVVVGSGSESTTGVGSVVVGSLNASVGNTNVIVGYQTNLNLSGATVSGFHTIVGSLITLSATSNYESTTIIGKSAVSGGSAIRSIVIGESASQGSSATDSIVIGYQAADDGGTRTNSTIIGFKAATNSYDSGTGSTASATTIVGTYAGYHSKGTENVYIGRSAGLCYDQNTGTIQTGGNNVAVGSQAGYHLTTSSNNVLIGRSAGYELTTGGDNVFLGQSSGNGVSTGGSNVAVGYAAGMAHDSSATVVIGYNAGGSATSTGGEHTIIGNSAGTGDVSGATVIIGSSSGQADVGYANVVIGRQALGTSAGSSGQNNVIIGYRAQNNSNALGTSNVIIGPNAAVAAGTSGFVNIVGTAGTGVNINGLGGGGSVTLAGGTATGSGSFAAGPGAIAKNAIAIGWRTGWNLTTGDSNTLLGRECGQALTEGSDNWYSGYQSGRYNVTGNNNVAIGNFSGYSAHGDGNIFLGYQAGYNETGSNKLYISNSGTTTPLIYGEFDNKLCRVNGNFQRVVFGSTETTTSGTIHIRDNTNWATQADATDNTASTGLLGIALGATADVGLVLFGDVDYTITGNVGTPVYLDTTAGGFTTTAPTGSGNIVRVMGHIIGSNKIFFNPGNDWLEIM